MCATDRNPLTMSTSLSAPPPPVEKKCIPHLNDMRVAAAPLAVIDCCGPSLKVISVALCVALAAAGQERCDWVRMKTIVASLHAWVRARPGGEGGAGRGGRWGWEGKAGGKEGGGGVPV